jgi:hypothetical protein
MQVCHSSFIVHMYMGFMETACICGFFLRKGVYIQKYENYGHTTDKEELLGFAGAV